MLGNFCDVNADTVHMVVDENVPLSSICAVPYIHFSYVSQNTVQQAEETGAAFKRRCLDEKQKAAVFLYTLQSTCACFFFLFVLFFWIRTIIATKASPNHKQDPEL